MKVSLFVCIVVVLLCVGCQDKTPTTPRPRAYPRINFPDRQVASRTLDQFSCPFTFDYPGYTQVVQDSLFFGSPPEHPCWFHLYYPGFDGRLYFSYHDALGQKSLDQLKTDAFEMMDVHNDRANYIEERRLMKGDSLSGVLFLIDGPAASPVQFYLTDDKRHFLKGAYYFNTQARPDSLAPMVDFVRQDVFDLLESFRWTETD